MLDRFSLIIMQTNKNMSELERGYLTGRIGCGMQAIIESSLCIHRETNILLPWRIPICSTPPLKTNTFIEQTIFLVRNTISEFGRHWRNLNVEATFNFLIGGFGGELNSQKQKAMLSQTTVRFSSILCSKPKHRFGDTKNVCVCVYKWDPFPNVYKLNLDINRIYSNRNPSANMRKHSIIMYFSFASIKHKHTHIHTRHPSKTTILLLNSPSSTTGIEATS